MSAEDNKTLAWRWLDEVWNKGDLSLIDELIAPNYVLHDPIRPGLKGRAGIKESIATFRAAFPDIHFTIEAQIAEGEQIVSRYIVQGTHLGPLMGIPATGKQGAPSSERRPRQARKSSPAQKSSPVGKSSPAGKPDPEPQTPEAKQTQQQKQTQQPTNQEKSS